MEGPDQRAAFDAVQVELDNLRPAWLWAVEQGQYELLEPPIFGMLPLSAERGFQSGLDQVLDASISAVEASGPPVEYRLLLVKLYLSWCSQSMDFSTSLPEIRVRSCHDLIKKENAERRLGLWYSILGANYINWSDFRTGIEILVTRLEWLRQTGSSLDIAYTITFLAPSYFY